MAVMTFVMTAFLVACSVDDSDDLMDIPYNGTNDVVGSIYRVRWIADKKTIGNTRALMVFDDKNYNIEMGGWTLPVEFILKGTLQGNDLNEAVVYANAHPEILNVMLIWMGTTDTSSSFFRISPYASDHSLAFKISFQNSVKECKLYLDTNGSALSLDDKRNSLLGVLKVDSMEIIGTGLSMMDKNGFSLTLSGEKE